MMNNDMFDITASDLLQCEEEEAYFEGQASRYREAEMVARMEGALAARIAAARLFDGQEKEIHAADELRCALSTLRAMIPESFAPSAEIANARVLLDAAQTCLDRAEVRHAA